jgi:hypothetical protein
MGIFGTDDDNRLRLAGRLAQPVYRCRRVGVEIGIKQGQLFMFLVNVEIDVGRRARFERPQQGGTV